MSDFFLSQPDQALFSTLIGQLHQQLNARGVMLATAESCTGGLMASLCTDMAGSSAWFAGGIVSYTNSMKETVLGVPASVLAEHGAVSGLVVEHMARGALRVCHADIAVAVSGIAGPGGGTPGKPVGTVWIAWAKQEAGRDPRVFAKRFLFPGTRAEIRLATAERAFLGVLEHMEK